MVFRWDVRSVQNYRDAPSSVNNREAMRGSVDIRWLKLEDDPLPPMIGESRSGQAAEDSPRYVVGRH